MMDATHKLTPMDDLLINGLISFLKLCKYEPVRPGVKAARIAATVDALSPKGVDFIGPQIDFLTNI